MNITLGEVAEINCGANNAIYIGWFVNGQRVIGTSSKSFDNTKPAVIVNDLYMRTLRVVGSSDSNGAHIVCLAILHVGDRIHFARSEPALILVQGDVEKLAETPCHIW